MKDSEQKNINLRLIHDEDNDERYKLSLSALFDKFRQFLSLWLILSAALGLVFAGGTFWVSQSISHESVTALISYKYDGIEKGLDPAGRKLDVNKIRAPGIISNVLKELDISEELSENVRRAVSIEGIIPDKAQDEIALYKGIYSRAGSKEAADSLLSVDYNSSYYLIKLDNAAAGLDSEEGRNVMNGILKGYQEYFFRTYGYNEALGDSISAIDYKDYDYPIAVDIFRTTLDDVYRYISRIQQKDPVGFRSSRTGYNFDDIKRMIDTVKTAELDEFSAYITVNDITRDKQSLMPYYEYKISDLERKAEVTKAELDSVNDSINNYEKDTIMLFDESSDEKNRYSQASKNYDELIDRKLVLEDDYSNKQARIEYYKLRAEQMQDNEENGTKDFSKADERIEELYSRINDIISITEKTTDDYYENVVFENAFNILIPASGGEHKADLRSMAKILLILEGALFAVYVMASTIMGVMKCGRQKNSIKTDETITE